MNSKRDYSPLKIPIESGFVMRSLDCKVDHWYSKEGKLHREDGPAITTCPCGQNHYYLNGEKISEELFLKVTQGPLEDLPLYMGLGYDEYIAKRLKGE